MESIFLRICRGFLFTLLFAPLCTPTSAQDSEVKGEHWTKRIFTGGSLGLQFGNATYIDVSPIVGYRITDRLQAGLGATYIYYKFKDTFYNYSYETSIYGGRTFARYFILENLFAHTEYEILNMEVPKIIGNSYQGTKRENITSVLVGGGYAQPIGENSALLLMLLWNLTEDQFSPYQNPIVRVGVNIGF
jgi:hypothetical protein